MGIGLLEASMVVIGDELLSGHVADANSPWLAARLAAHGVPLSRVQVVPDEFAAIDEALSIELDRSRPRLVVTSGGIGSTPDDVTYEAIAVSLGRGVVEDGQLAARMDEIVARTRGWGFEVDEQLERAIRRMSMVPAGSRVLAAAGSWLPAVIVDVDGGCDATADPGACGVGASVVVLPGVPQAFRALVTDVIEPAMLIGVNDVPTTVEVGHRLPESLLNKVFAQIGDQLPAVKLGSYPGRESIVRLTGPADDVEAARAMVASAVAALVDSAAGRRYLAERDVN